MAIDLEEADREYYGGRGNGNGHYNQNPQNHVVDNNMIEINLNDSEE